MTADGTISSIEEKVDGRPGYDRRMSREEINALPIVRYEGPVEVVRDREHLKKAVAELAAEPVLGFDTETRPSFRKGESYDPSLLQLTGAKKTYVFQLRHLKFPRVLRALLSEGSTVKAGVAHGHDVKMLQELAAFEPRGFVDLGDLATEAGIQNHGLRGLSAVLLGFRISKTAQVSNWARADLTPSQVQYAATDSWVSREIYLKLRTLAPEH